MLVERAIARAYADLILEAGGFTGEVLRETVDFDGGTFCATVDFVVDGEGHWGITGTEWERTKVYGPSGKLAAIRTDYLTRVCDLIQPYLQHPGRLLIADQWIVDKRETLSPEAPPRRMIHRRAGDGYQHFMVLPGPSQDREALRHTVDFGPPHWQAGAVVDRDAAGMDVPAHGDVIADDDLRRLLSHALAVYMRMTSYDGHLVWRRDAPEAGS